jgi:ferrous iron transport protein A
VSINGSRMIPLSFLGECELGRVAGYLGGRELVQRVVEMGLHKGELVRVIKSSGGPVLVQVNDSKIALGYGVASKIMVVAEGD